MTLKLPSGVGAPGFWAVSGCSDGVMNWAPAEATTPAGYEFLPWAYGWDPESGSTSFQD